MAGRPRREEADGGGRERLLAAAAKLFAAKGYAAASVRDILKVANVTAPVLYYHFGSKEGLFVGLIRQGIEAFDVEMTEVLAAAPTPGEKVRAFCRFHVEVQRRFADLRRVVEAAIAGPPEATPRFDFRKVFAGHVTRLAGLVTAAVASGEFRSCDPTTTALALIGAAEMTVRARRMEWRVPEAKDPERGALKVVLDGLRAPGAAGRRGSGRTRRATRTQGAATDDATTRRSVKVSRYNAR